VYGLMRTADSVSPSLTVADVSMSLALYVIVYLIMYPTGVVFMASLARRGPAEVQDPHVTGIESGRPSRPFEDAARAGFDS